MELNRGKKNIRRKYSVHLLSCTIQVLESSIFQSTIRKAETVFISLYEISKILGCNFQSIAKGDKYRPGKEVFLLN